MLLEFGVQFVENIHHRILRSFGVFKVLQAHTKNLVHVPLVQHAKVVDIARLLKGNYQLLVGRRIG